MTNLRWLAAAALLLNTVPLLGQSRAPAGPSKALLKDAASYADQVGVGLDEAVRRLQLQHEIGALDAALSREERDLFAGLWIEHEPEYRVVVRFTHPSGEERLRARLAHDTSLAPLVAMRRAALSLVQLEERRAQASRLARQLRFTVDTNINVEENLAEIHSNRPQALRAALAAARAHLPDRVEIVAVSDLSRPAVLRGGEHGTDCTGGFTVINRYQQVGLSTAAHCANNEPFQGGTLTFVAEDQEGHQDVQWHRASCEQHAVSHEFRDDVSSSRACVGEQHRDQQPLGAYVCKWGMVTGRSCGFIKSKFASPSYIADSQATFVWVDAVAQVGDSGGPWFVGDIAYGTHSGMNVETGFAIYMPINYISSLGVTLLTHPCNPLPKPTFTWTAGASGYVTFDASGSYDPDGSIVSYTWDFGDGSELFTTTSPWADHSYAYGDWFPVDLSVSDNRGGQGFNSQYVYGCFLYVCDD